MYVELPEMVRYIEVSGNAVNGTAIGPKRRRTGVDRIDRRGGLHLAYESFVRRTLAADKDLAAALDAFAQRSIAYHGDLCASEHYLDHHVHPMTLHAPTDFSSDRKFVESMQVQHLFHRSRIPVPEEREGFRLHVLFPYGVFEGENLSGRVRVFMERPTPRHYVNAWLHGLENELRRSS